MMENNTDQIKRITDMEAALDESRAALDNLEAALKQYASVQDKIQLLDYYYGSDDWNNDYEDQADGKLPEGLKCGVLSEDAIYDLLYDNRDLALHLLETVGAYIQS